MDPVVIRGFFGFRGYGTADVVHGTNHVLVQLMLLCIDLMETNIF